ncbi:MAG: hypothetical protein ACHQD8_00750 [Chitinophagales bacterium]
METQTQITQSPGKLNGMAVFFKKIGSKITSKITSLFEPEEVEVTFKVEGEKVSYTYTKVSHKQVA